jgi:hypothetical protein
MKKLLILTIILNSSFLFCVQNYDYGKIELKNGEYIEGKKLLLNNEHNVDVVKININKYKVVEYNLSDIKTIWKGIPSYWELQKGLIIGSSVGLLGAIINSLSVDRNDRYYNPGDVAGPFALIPIFGGIGYLMGKTSVDSKYQNVINNWEIIYNTNNIKEINIKESKPNKYEELEKLFELKEKGIITDEEYEVEKTKILDSK